MGRLDHANSIIRNKEQADALIESNPGTRITSDPITNAISFFAFNTDHPTLQDDRVRQAMSLALDREEMVQILSGGLGRVLPVFLWPLVFDKEPSEDELGRWWRHDPAEAKKLVAAAGAEGVKLTTLFTPSYGASQPNNIAFVTSPWKDIGINLESQDVDFQTFSALRFTSKFRDDPESQMMQGYSTAAPTAKGSFFDLVHTQSSQNVHKVNDPDIDAWAEQAVGEFDPDARRELHRKIWDRELDRVLRLSMAQTFTTRRCSRGSGTTGGMEHSFPCTTPSIGALATTRRGWTSSARSVVRRSSGCGIPRRSSRAELAQGFVGPGLCRTRGAGVVSPGMSAPADLIVRASRVWNERDNG